MSCVRIQGIVIGVIGGVVGWVGSSAFGAGGIETSDIGVHEEFPNGVEVVVFGDEAFEGQPIQVWTRIERGAMAERGHERGASVLAGRSVLASGLGDEAGFGVEWVRSFVGVDEGLIDGTLGWDRVSMDQQGMLTTTTHIMFMGQVEEVGAVGSGFAFAAQLVDGGWLTDDGVETARGWVLNELDSMEETRGESWAHRQWLPALLDHSGAGQLVIPDRAQVETISVDEVQGYVDRVWDPSLLTVMVVGDVDPDAVLEEAREAFGGLEGRTPASLSVREIVKESSVGQVVDFRDETLGGTTGGSRVGMVWFGDRDVEDFAWDDEGHRESLVMALGAEIVRHRLSRVVRSELDSVNQVRAQFALLASRVRFGQLIVDYGQGMEIDDDEWAKVVDAIERERIRMIRDGFGEMEVDRGREWLIQQWGFEMDQWRGLTSRERAQSLHWMMLGDRRVLDLEGWSREAEQIVQEITIEEVNEMVRSRIGFGEDPSVLILRDIDHDEDVIDRSRVKKVLAESGRRVSDPIGDDWLMDLRGPLLARSAEGGRVVEVSMHPGSGVVSGRLSNGAWVRHRKMIDAQDPKQISMSVWVGTGEIESVDMHGVGDVVSEALRRGLIRSRTRSEVKGVLIEDDISISVRRGVWGIEIVLSSMVDEDGDEKIDRMLEVVGGLMTDLRIEQGLIDQMSIDAGDGDRWIGAPIGAVEYGIAQSVGRGIDRRDLNRESAFGSLVDARSARQWWSQQLMGSRIEVGIAGPADAQRVLQSSARWIGGIPSASRVEEVEVEEVVEDTNNPDIRGEESVRIEVSDWDYEGAKESVVVGFVCQDVEVHHQRALTISRWIMKWRLQELTDDRAFVGMAIFDLLDDSATFFIEIEGNDPQREELVSLVLNEMESFAIEGIQTEDVDDVKDMIQSVIDNGFETVRFWSSRLSDGSRWDQHNGVEYIWSMLNGYQDLTAEDVHSAYQEWYTKGEHFRIDLVDEE